MFRIWIACLSLLQAAPALASGGLSCTTEEPKVKFLVDSGITRGMGNPLFGFKGDLEISDPAVAEDLRKSKFEIGDLTQHWLDADELKIQLYREREEPFGEIVLLIETSMVDEGSYSGTYTITVFDMAGDTTGLGKTVSLEGKTSCFAE